MGWNGRPPRGDRKGEWGRWLGCPVLVLVPLQTAHRRVRQTGVDAVGIVRPGTKERGKREDAGPLDFRLDGYTKVVLWSGDQQSTSVVEWPPGVGGGVPVCEHPSNVFGRQ